MLELRHPHADRGHDLYETPACAVEALLRVEKLPKWIWEPACGPGNIVKVLRDKDHNVFATDIVDYGDHQHGRLDFLNCAQIHADTDAIVTNPPGKLAAAFVRHAVHLCPLVCMLLRLPFYESEARTDILEFCHLARIHVFRKRLPMMHRDGWTGPKASSAMAFAWYVWDRSHTGLTTIDRISWEA